MFLIWFLVAPLLFTKEMVERMILARLAIPEDQRPRGSEEPTHFTYLLGVYERAFAEEKRISGAKEAEPKLAVLREAKTFAVSYSGLVIQMPDMFASETGVAGSTVLTDKLLSESLMPEFFAAFVDRFKDDGLGDVCPLSCRTLFAAPQM